MKSYRALQSVTHEEGIGFRLVVEARRQHIHYTYYSKACDPRKKTWGAEGRSDASASSYKYLKLKYL